MVLSWSSYKMASKMLSEICHLECVFRSPFISQSVSVQCSVSLAGGKKSGKEGQKVRQLSKMWSEFREAALVTTWGADLKIFIIHDYPLVSLLSPQRSPLNCPSVSHLSLYVAPAANLCLPLTDSSLERRRMLET